MIQTMNATAARQDFFDILTAARDRKQITKIKLNGLVVARIVPEEEKKFDWVKYEKDMQKAIKVLRKYNWDDVLEVRKLTKTRKYKGW